MPYLKELDLVCRELDKTTRRRFSNEVRSVCALVGRLLPKTKNERYKKILVQCVHTAPSDRDVDQLGVAFVEVQRDVPAFFSLSRREKQEWALHALYEGVEKVTHSQGLVPSELSGAFQEAENLDFENVWRWRVKSSSSRRHKAEIWIEHDLEECRIVGVLTTRSGERISRTVLCTTEPDEWVFSRCLGELSWESAETAVLCDRRGQRVGTIALPSQS